MQAHYIYWSVQLYYRRLNDIVDVILASELMEVPSR